jgi:hypothetical protein
MAFVVKDRVKVTTTTTGTGTLTLGSAVSGFQSFSVVGNNNTTTYAIVDAATNAWEVGIGTYSSSGNTLTRTTVLESSNSGSLVNFAAGSKEVFVTYAAERAVTAAPAASAGQLMVSTSDALSSWQAASGVTVGAANTAGVATVAIGLRPSSAAWSATIGGSSITEGQVLAYNATFNEFQPTTVAGGGGVTSIIAGTGISISSTGPSGTGAVTVSTSGGGGGNPPPGGDVGITLATPAMFGSGYIPYPPEFMTATGWVFASLSVVLLSTSSSQPTFPPFPWNYNGSITSFVTSYGTIYMHNFFVGSSDFYALDPSGFPVSGPVVGGAVIYTTVDSIPSGNAGYSSAPFLYANYFGPDVAFPVVSPPPSGTQTLYDSKLIVFYQDFDVLIPVSGVTQSAVEAATISAAVYNIPSTLVVDSPPAPASLTYPGSWQVGVVGVVGYSFEP